MAERNRASLKSKNSAFYPCSLSIDGITKVVRAAATETSICFLSASQRKPLCEVVTTVHTLCNGRTQGSVGDVI